MGEIVNLRQARKARKSADRESEAEASRARHGLSKADKRLAEAARQRHEAVLAGARRDCAED